MSVVTDRASSAAAPVQSCPSEWVWMFPRGWRQSTQGNTPPTGSTAKDAEAAPQLLPFLEKTWSAALPCSGLLPAPLGLEFLQTTNTFRARGQRKRRSIPIVPGGELGVETQRHTQVVGQRKHLRDLALIEVRQRCVQPQPKPHRAHRFDVLHQPGKAASNARQVIVGARRPAVKTQLNQEGVYFMFDPLSHNGRQGMPIRFYPNQKFELSGFSPQGKKIRMKERLTPGEESPSSHPTPWPLQRRTYTSQYSPSCLLALGRCNKTSIANCTRYVSSKSTDSSTLASQADCTN